MPNPNAPLFHQRYRIPSMRLSGWNYANGQYFVTICTHDRVPWFGHIQNKFMCLSDIGSIAHQYWHDIPHHFPHVTLDAYIVMPDHIHGIIMIDQRAYKGHIINGYTRNPHHQPEWRSGSLGSIMNQFKRACTKRIRDIGCDDFAWQTRFHDQIIHDQRALETIRRYIINNPSKWK